MRWPDFFALFPHRKIIGKRAEFHFPSAAIRRWKWKIPAQTGTLSKKRANWVSPPPAVVAGEGRGVDAEGAG